ncbi:MAG: hypothetical protein QM639_16115 [Rhodocyclaceae bacterium]
MNALRMLLIAASLTALPAVAQNNFNFMKRTPMSQFTKEDTKLFTDTLVPLLEDPASSGAHDWSNPKTGAGGTITLTPKGSVKPGCREVNIASHSRTLKGHADYVLCKKNGMWSLDN